MQARGKVLGVFVVAAFALSTPAAQAMDIVVDTGTDAAADPNPTNGCEATGGNTCTLREAYAHAAVAAGDDRILLNQGGLPNTITITEGPINTFGDGNVLEIVGPGADALTLTAPANPAPDGLLVNGGYRLTLRGLRIANTPGIAVYSNSNHPLTVRDCVFAGNRGNTGAAIRTVHSVDVSDSTFIDNRTGIDGSGGAIYLEGGAASVIRDSLFVENHGGRGGAIFTGGNTTIENSTFTGNIALDQIHDGNGYDAGGGAIYANAIFGNNLTINSSTIVDNETLWGVALPTINSDGGGIRLEGGMLTTIRDSILAGNRVNTENQGGGPNELAGSSFTEVSYSLLEAGLPVGFAGSSTGSVFAVDPALAPLADNGGPTETRLPAADSPVVDAGLTPAGITTDQRGLARPVDLDLTNAPGGDGADIGAVERAAPVTEPPPGTDPPSPPPPGTTPRDTAPPETSITKRPKKKSKQRKASFEFASSEPGSSFECSRDGKGFEPCSSPVAFRAKRKNTFAVVAIDAAGNRDATPATAKWKVRRR